MLELRGIHASYGPIPVLHDVNLRVEQGQMVALLGRNGAGKTTSLRVASGMLAPNSGEICLKGQSVAGRPSEEIARMGLSHVPEGRGVLPHMTVKENLEVGAYRLGISRRQASRRIAEVSQSFPRLVERLDQRAGSLSGGEQQMLVIARALMAEPEILLVDEPSLGLAPLIVDEVYRLLARLNQEGLTILLVEQYVDLALEVAAYAYVLEKGRMVMHGHASELAGDRHLVDAYLE